MKAVATVHYDHPHTERGQMDIIEFLNARLDEDEQVVRTEEPSVHDQTAGMSSRPDQRTRELWKIDAKRKILSEYSATGEEGVGRVVAVLAAEYADHPDYQKEWAL